MKKILITSIPVVFLLFACSDDIPDPKVKPKTESAHEHRIPLQAVQASSASNNREFSVKHIVKGNAVYIECKTTSVSFRKNSEKKQAKIILKVDHRLVNEYRSAAFVVRNLKPGNHKISLEVVNEANESYHLGKEFMVTI
ncbi:hypothetical protein [Niallia sp. 03133]|uniref:hypothetical protein n=1 Tax=Niallia sp. 03133 TaxID=3458060 RepID=UPI004043E665